MNIRNQLKGRDHFYLMHLSYDSYNKEENRKELWNFARTRSIIGLDNRHVKCDWPAIHNDVRTGFSSQWSDHFDMICENMSEISMINGDLVIVMAGWDRVLGIGKIVGPHQFVPAYRKRKEFFDHIRPVEWLIEYDYDDALKIQPLKGFERTLFRVEKRFKWWGILKELESVDLPLIKKPMNLSKQELLKRIYKMRSEIDRETSRVERYKRSRELVNHLKQLYDYRCQLCSEKTMQIPEIPMNNGTNYVEVHHIMGFNEVEYLQGPNQDEADYIIDEPSNCIVLCVYHHKLLHKHNNGYTYDGKCKRFVSDDGASEIPLELNIHL